MGERIGLREKEEKEIREKKRKKGEKELKFELEPKCNLFLIPFSPSVYTFSLPLLSLHFSFSLLSLSSLFLSLYFFFLSSSLLFFLSTFNLRTLNQKMISSLFRRWTESSTRRKKKEKRNREKKEEDVKLSFVQSHSKVKSVTFFLDP